MIYQFAKKKNWNNATTHERKITQAIPTIVGERTNCSVRQSGTCGRKMTSVTREQKGNRFPNGNRYCAKIARQTPLIDASVSRLCFAWKRILGDHLFRIRFGSDHFINTFAMHTIRWKKKQTHFVWNGICYAFICIIFLHDDFAHLMHSARRRQPRACALHSILCMYSAKINTSALSKRRNPSSTCICSLRCYDRMTFT